MAESEHPDPGSGASPAESAGSTVWRRSTGVSYVESPAESAQRVVVLDLDHPEQSPYVFEGSAAQIWACVDGDRTEAEIVADLAEAFEAAADVVTQDVIRFLSQLRRLGLIVPVV